MNNIRRSMGYTKGRGFFTRPRLLHLSHPVRSEAPPITPPTRNPFKRIARYFRNDPFARVSVIFGGTVLTVLLVIEAFIPKEAKKVKPQVAILPPSVSHATVPRERELASLLSSVPSVLSTRPSVVVVTGPEGSGKTELVNQFVTHFVKASSPTISKKESSKPIVIHLDASGTRPLEDSIRYALGSLGMMSSQLENPSSSSHLQYLLDKLGEQKARWLLIVDGAENETAPLIRRLIDGSGSESKYRKGYILITTRSQGIQLLNQAVKSQIISLDKGLTQGEAADLFYKLAGSDAVRSKEQTSDLLSDALHNTPLLVALAGLTIRMYAHFCRYHEGEIRNDLLTQYRDMIQLCDDRVSDGSHDGHVTEKVTQLYIEALSSTDNYFLHSVDFLSICDLDEPVPVSLIKEHLKNPFYRLPLVPVSSSILEDTPTAPPTPPDSGQSYFSLIKSKISSITGWPPPPPPLLPHPSPPPDVLASLRLSPFVHAHARHGVELLSFSRGTKERIQNHFLAYTAPKLEKDHLDTEERRWNETAWFRRFRSFDSQSSLTSYRRSLPGLEKSKIVTEKEWNEGLSLSSSLTSYTDYIHCVSHAHRCLNSLREDLKYLSRDPPDLALRRYLRPHLLSVSSLGGVLTKRDRLRLEACLLSIDSSIAMDKSSYIAQYNELVERMREATVRGDYGIATVLTSLAELHYYNNDYQLAKQLLLSSVSLYENSSSRPSSSFPTISLPSSSFSPSPFPSSPSSTLSFSDSMDYASSLAMLGLIYASLEERGRCCETLEKALALFQTLPSTGEVPKKQRRLVATTVTDLGHAYLSTGDLVSAKRYLDLASVAQRGIHGDDHPEVVRTLNVLSIVHSLLGDSDKSKELRREAGKIQSRLQLISDIV